MQADRGLPPKRTVAFQHPPVSFRDCWREGSQYGQYAMRLVHDGCIMNTQLEHTDTCNYPAPMWASRSFEHLQMARYCLKGRFVCNPNHQSKAFLGLLVVLPAFLGPWQPRSVCFRCAPELATGWWHRHGRRLAERIGWPAPWRKAKVCTPPPTLPWHLTGAPFKRKFIFQLPTSAMLVGGRVNQIYVPWQLFDVFRCFSLFVFCLLGFSWSATLLHVLINSFCNSSALTGSAYDVSPR